MECKHCLVKKQNEALLNILSTSEIMRPIVMKLTKDESASALEQQLSATQSELDAANLQLAECSRGADVMAAQIKELTEELDNKTSPELWGNYQRAKDRAEQAEAACAAMREVLLNYIDFAPSCGGGFCDPIVNGDVKARRSHEICTYEEICNHWFEADNKKRQALSSNAGSAILAEIIKLRREILELRRGEGKAE